MRLHWTPADSTTDGRYAIQSESVRGEGRFYWLDVMPSEARRIYDTDPSFDGSYDKRTVKRATQRLEDMICSGVAP